MKVVFLIDQIYLHGGIERVLSIKANYLADVLNYSITIITTNQQERPYCYAFSKRINFIDLDVKYNKKKSYFSIQNLKKVPKHVVQLKKSILKFNPDAVVVCSHSTDTYFVPFICRKIPKIKEFHSSKYNEKKKKQEKSFSLKKMFFFFTEKIEKLYDKIVVLSEGESKFYMSQNLSVIPNPLTFSTNKTSLVNTKKIIAVGRVAEVKNFEEIINVWSFLKKDFPAWEVNIFGGGEMDYLNKLQDMINEKGLKEKVFLRGESDNIFEEMLNSSIYIMTSISECFPLVLLEAQACGLPIISYDCPTGPRSILTNDSGVLVQNRNRNELILNLKKIILDEELRRSYGYKAKKNSENYSIEIVMKKWDELFHNLKKH